MNEIELNKKLAEWAGFEEADIKKHYYWEIGGTRVAKWSEPSSEYHMKLPRFTQSLNACFKWLVPKLGTYSLWSGRPRHTGIPEEIPVCEHNAEVWTDNISNYGYAHSKDSLALALCLAMEVAVKKRY